MSEPPFFPSSAAIAAAVVAAAERLGEDPLCVDPAWRGPSNERRTRMVVLIALRDAFPHVPSARAARWLGFRDAASRGVTKPMDATTTTMWWPGVGLAALKAAKLALDAASGWPRHTVILRDRPADGVPAIPAKLLKAGGQVAHLVPAPTGGGSPGQASSAPRPLVNLAPLPPGLLSDRVLREIENRGAVGPATLATLLDVKELLIDRVLSGLALEGRIAADPMPEEGRRRQLWRVVKVRESAE